MFQHVACEKNKVICTIFNKKNCALVLKLYKIVIHYLAKWEPVENEQAIMWPVTTRWVSNQQLYIEKYDHPQTITNRHPKADRLVKQMENEFQHIKVPPTHNYSQA